MDEFRAPASPLQLSMSDERLIDTIGTIYDAALDPDRWYDTIRRVADFVGAERGMVGLTDTITGALDVSHLYRMDPVLMDRWARDYGSEDPWADRMTAVAEGDVGRGSDLISYEELERNPVFRAIAVPCGAYDTCWTAIASNRLQIGFLSVFQGEELGVFSRQSVERMAVLSPHLVRAARIHRRLADLRSQNRALAGAVDELSFGLLTCTADARIVAINRTAEQLFRSDGPLRLGEHRLAARTESAAAQLRELVSGASSTARGDAAVGGGVVRLAMGEDRWIAATVATRSWPSSSRCSSWIRTRRN